MLRLVPGWFLGLMRVFAERVARRARAMRLAGGRPRGRDRPTHASGLRIGPQKETGRPEAPAALAMPAGKAHR